MKFHFPQLLASRAASSLLAIGLLACVTQASAQTWDGSSSTLWNTGANWVSNVAPVNGAALIFDADTPAIANLSTSNDIAALTVNSITIDNGSTAGVFTLAGNAITLAGNIATTGSTGTPTHLISLNMTMSAERTVTTALNNNLEISGAISGAFALVKAGAGTLTLSNSSNSFFVSNADSLKLVNGTVKLGASNALASAGRVTISSAAGTTAVLDLNGFNNTVGTGPFIALDFQAANSATAVGTVNTGGGMLTLGGNVRVLNGGVNTINGNLSLGAATRIFGIANGVQAVDLDVTAGISGSAGAGITKSGFGTLQLSGNNTFDGVTTVEGGILRLNYATNDTNKLTDTRALNLSGGTVDLAGGNHTEVVANTVLTGANSVTRSSGTAKLALGAVTGAGTAQFGADSIATTTTAVNAASTLNWATVLGAGGIELATKSGNDIIAYTSYTDVTRLDSGSKVIANGATTSIQINDGTGAPADITLGAATTNINAIKMNATGGTATVAIATGETLRLGETFGNIITDTDSGALTISGPGSLTAGGGANTAATISLNNNSASNAITIGAVVANNGSGAITLAKSGVGNVNLDGANTYTGATTVAAGGMLTARNNTALGSNANGTTIADGAALQFEGGIAIGNEALTISGSGVGGTGGVIRNLSGTNSYGGQITLLTHSTITSVAGDLTFTNAAFNPLTNFNFTFDGAGNTTVNGVITTNGNSVSIKNGTGTLTLAGNNSFTGTQPTSVNLGVLSITHNNALGGTAGVTNVGVSGGAQAALQISNNITTAESINLVNTTGVSNAGAIRSTSGSNTITGTVTVDDGNSRINTDSGLLTISGELRGDPTSASAARTVTVGGAGNTTLSGVVRNGIGGTPGVLHVSKDGDGTLTMSNTNTYTGNTTVSGGTLVTTKAAALPGYNSAAKVVVNGGTLGVQVGGAGWTTGEVDTLLTNGTKTSGALGIDTTNGNVSQWAAFTPTNLGALGLNKLGANTLTLSAANTYTGSTTVTAGTLLVDVGGSIGNGAVAMNGGSLTVNGAVGNGGVTVNTGATLGGNGTIAGNVALNGGTLAPGNSPGLLSVGSLTLPSGTTAFEVNGTSRGTTFDAIDVTSGGAVQFGANFTINFGSLLSDPLTLNLFSFNTASTGNFASVVSTGIYSGIWLRDNPNDAWTFTDGSQTLTFSETTGNLGVIPEPASWVLLAIGLTVVVTLRRRRSS